MVIGANETGKCPHCGNSNRFEKVKTGYNVYEDSLTFPEGNEYKTQKLGFCRCTACHELIIFLQKKMIWPLGTVRPKCPSEVPKELAEDYNEACLVEPLSKKASAALARRCLQNLLHHQGIKKKDLNEEIDEVVKILPSHLSNSIDSIRHIGNFGTHPIKAQQTGEIVQVEDGETEWVLEVLEQLFDYYYVAPAKTNAKRAALNLKLKAVGKPALK